MIAETLDGWQPPSTPEGRKVLHEHYLWAKEAHDQERLLLAGPLNMSALTRGAPYVLGAPTGLLVFRAASKAEAEGIASQHPMHRHGFRKNVVYPWSVRSGQAALTESLGAVLATPIELAWLIRQRHAAENRHPRDSRFATFLTRSRRHAPRRKADVGRTGLAPGRTLL